jgi:hypothetical protein
VWHRAVEGAARCQVKRALAGGVTRWGGTGVFAVRVPPASLPSLRSPARGRRPLCFGHDSGRNECFRGHPGVAGRFRRVVVARRCTRQPSRRVMVETPPRAGPSPPHGPARFFCLPRGARAPLARRGPRCAGPPAPWRGPRHQEFTGVSSRAVAWRRSFEGITQAGRRPNHGCRISADGTEPSAREALCTSPTVRSRHGRRGGGPFHGPRQCRAAPRPRPTIPVGQALGRPARSRPPGPASTPSLPDLFRGGTSFRGDQHKAPQAR